MPQIWPMNWIILFWGFALTFVVFLIFVYFLSFSVSITAKSSFQPNISTHLDWKW